RRAPMRATRRGLAKRNQRRKTQSFQYAQSSRRSSTAHRAICGKYGDARGMAGPNSFCANQKMVERDPMSRAISAWAGAPSLRQFMFRLSCFLPLYLPVFRGLFFLFFLFSRAFAFCSRLQRVVLHLGTFSSCKCLYLLFAKNFCADLVALH